MPETTVRFNDALSERLRNEANAARNRGDTVHSCAGIAARALIEYLERKGD